MYHPSRVAHAGEAADHATIGELPERFWLHTTASVAFALLMLLAISALAAWTLRALEDLWLRAAKKDQGDK